MKQLALAALVATSMSAIALPVLAQDTTPVAAKWDRQAHRPAQPPIHNGRGLARGAGAGGLFALVCSDRGAEALEVGLVRIAHRLDLTEAQKPLFDALKTTALTTQTSFADTCKAALPAQADATRPDLLERLKSGLRLEQARLSAMNSVLPDFEAFYTSLTPAQKADLMPARGDRSGHGPRDRGQRFGRH